jgi:hypothetical protein
MKGPGWVGFFVLFGLSGNTGRQRVKAHVAQLAEHVLGKDEVISSNLIMGSSMEFLTRKT